METLKNFLVGLTVIILGLIIIAFTLLTWPLIIGISSILLSLLAGVLFILLVFYVIVLVGHIARQMLIR